MWSHCVHCKLIVVDLWFAFLKRVCIELWAFKCGLGIPISLYRWYNYTHWHFSRASKMCVQIVNGTYIQVSNGTYLHACSYYRYDLMYWRICDYSNVLILPLPVQGVGVAEVLDYKLCPLTPQLLGCVSRGGIGDGQRYRGQASDDLCSTGEQWSVYYTTMFCEHCSIIMQTYRALMALLNKIANT